MKQKQRNKSVSTNQKNIPLSTIDLLISDEWILKLDVIFILCFLILKTSGLVK